MDKSKESVKITEEAHAYAYTPGLKVKKATIMTKVRKLPISGSVLVNLGDPVDFDTVIARSEIPGVPSVIKAALLLSIESDELPKYLDKYERDPVEKDEVIGKYIAFFGLVKRFVRSPVKGIIESISTSTGQIIIRGMPEAIEVKAYVPGKVIEILPKEGAVIETYAAFIQAIFGIGGERHGKLNVLVDSPDVPLTADLIHPEHKGKILVGGSVITAEALQKAIELGIIGLVSASIRDVDVMDFLGYEIGVAITGHEDIPLTVLITEGFGEMIMSTRTFNLLKSLNGREAAINGATQIRAGVMRPELIIPRDDLRGTKADSESTELSGGMQPGTPVRIIREPYFGALGTVMRLPVELQRVESESNVRVIEIEIEGSMERVIVPRANVEIIEE